MFNLPPSAMNVGISGDSDMSFYSGEVFKFAEVMRRMGGLEQRLHDALLHKDFNLFNKIFIEFKETKIELNGFTGSYEFLEQIAQGYLEAVDYEADKLLPPGERLCCSEQEPYAEIPFE